MSTSEGKCVLVDVGALISWCIYSYRIVMLLVPYMWANMTFLPSFGSKAYTSETMITQPSHIKINPACEQALSGVGAR